VCNEQHQTFGGKAEEQEQIHVNPDAVSARGQRHVMLTLPLTSL